MFVDLHHTQKLSLNQSQNSSNNIQTPRVDIISKITLRMSYFLTENERDPRDRLLTRPYFQQIQDGSIKPAEALQYLVNLHKIQTCFEVLVSRNNEYLNMFIDSFAQSIDCKDAFKLVESKYNLISTLQKNNAKECSNSFFRSAALEKEIQVFKDRFNLLVPKPTAETNDFILEMTTQIIAKKINLITYSWLHCCILASNHFVPSMISTEESLNKVKKFLNQIPLNDKDSETVCYRSIKAFRLYTKVVESVVTERHVIPQKKGWSKFNILVASAAGCALIALAIQTLKKK